MWLKDFVLALETRLKAIEAKYGEMIVNDKEIQVVTGLNEDQVKAVVATATAELNNQVAEMTRRLEEIAAAHVMPEIAAVVEEAI